MGVAKYVQIVDQVYATTPAIFTANSARGQYLEEADSQTEPSR
jgi:hypothetical protein